MTDTTTPPDLNGFDLSPVPAQLVWHDRERGLSFTWAGFANEWVTVHDGAPTGPVVDSFPVALEAQEAFIAANGAVSAILAVYQFTICRGYRHAPTRDQLADALAAALAIAEAEGEAVDTVHLQTVYNAARALRDHDRQAAKEAAGCQ